MIFSWFLRTLPKLQNLLFRFWFLGGERFSFLKALVFNFFSFLCCISFFHLLFEFFILIGFACIFHNQRILKDKGISGNRTELCEGELRNVPCLLELFGYNAKLKTVEWKFKSKWKKEIQHRKEKITNRLEKKGFPRGTDGERDSISYIVYLHKQIDWSVERVRPPPRTGGARNGISIWYFRYRHIFFLIFHI